MRLLALRVAKLDAGDLYFGEPRAVPRLPAIVLPALELEHVDLFALHFTDHFADHGRALHGRRAGHDLVPVGGEQYLVEADLRPRLGIHPGKPEGLALLGLELLPAGLDAGVH